MASRASFELQRQVRRYGQALIDLWAVSVMACTQKGGVKRSVRGLRVHQQELGAGGGLAGQRAEGAGGGSTRKAERSYSKVGVARSRLSWAATIPAASEG